MTLSRLATNGDIVGLHLLSGGQLVAQALVDDSFMFLQASRENLEKGMHGKGFGMFRMARIRGEERLYFSTLGLSSSRNECYKCSID